MSQSLAIWILIAVALVTANLPFLVQRPLFFFPWRLKGEPDGSSVTPVLSFVLAVVVYGVVGVAIYRFVGQLFIVSNATLVLVSVAILAVFVVLAALPRLLARQRYAHIEKPFMARFIEFLSLLFVVGVLGFSYEFVYGSVFPQSWEFYVVALCLYMVLGYPGFVYRYLLKRRRVLVTSKPATQAQATPL